MEIFNDVEAVCAVCVAYTLYKRQNFKQKITHQEKILGVSVEYEKD